MTSQVDHPFPAATESGAGELCLRCDYDLRGVPDDRPCPECGLLAERSRRGNNDLSDSTPGWLLCIAIGVALILLAQVIAGVWLAGLRYAFFEARPGDPSWVRQLFFGLTPHEMIAVFDVAAVLLIAGVWLLATPQQRVGRRAGEDRALRWLLRAVSVMPLIAMAFLHVMQVMATSFGSELSDMIETALLTIGCAPLSALMFVYLRRLALRVLHPRLAEHAAIVGVGFSVALVTTGAMLLAIDYSEQHHFWPWERYSFRRAILVPLTIAVPPILFGLWSALNSLRFIIAFAKAHRAAKRKWAAADQSGTASVAA